MESLDAGSSPYYQTRLTHHRQRTKVWRHVCRYLSRWISPTDAVLDLGAGWCDFSNQIQARRRVAMDRDAVITSAAADGVEVLIGDCTDLSVIPDATFDVVFASNLLEHLERGDAQTTLEECARVLRRDGTLILMQPNFRLAPRRYFDDFTHVTVYTDQSLRDLLLSKGWGIVTVRRRFMPLTVKSYTSALTFLVTPYLRSPIKPFAGQMLVVAKNSSPRGMEP